MPKKKPPIFAPEMPAPPPAPLIDRLEKRPNWRSLAGSIQNLSTFLAGFSITIMLLSLNKDILESHITIGQCVSVLRFIFFFCG